MTKFCVVLIISPSGAPAKKVASALLKARLAACVNILPAVQSKYWWKGKIESAGESLLIVKTMKTHLPRLMKHVQKFHPYSVPEIIAVPILSGHKPYLQWLAAETAG